MADRYWVGGTDTWDATAGTKWATTSGGTVNAGGAGSQGVIFIVYTPFIPAPPVVLSGVTISGGVTIV